MLVGQIIRLLQMLALAALQILVLNHIHLFGLATPMVSVAFLLYFPFDASRTGTLLWAFALGLIVDTFSNTPGMTASAMTFTAFLQPLLLDMMAPRDAADNMQPTYTTMGTWAHFRYIVFLVLVEHAVFFLLESFSFWHPLELLLSYVCSAALSILLIATLETLRGKTS